MFANDQADATVITAFDHMAIRLIALRAAGFDNVDLGAAATHGIAVARVPAYSPHAVAEHTFGLVLSLVRQIPRAFDPSGRAISRLTDSSDLILPERRSASSVSVTLAP